LPRKEPVIFQDWFFMKNKKSQFQLWFQYLKSDLNPTPLQVTQMKTGK
jgi:hypothetical protein